jgi:hypothetical protein
MSMTSDDYTNGFVVRTVDGAMVGFILASPDFRGAAGDCIFMLMPEDPALVDSPLGRLLAQSKVDGEHQWAGQAGDIDIRFEGRPRFRITSSGALVLPSGATIGSVAPLPRKQPR